MIVNKKNQGYFTRWGSRISYSPNIWSMRGLFHLLYTFNDYWKVNGKFLSEFKEI